jgi:hypothetical protein
MFGPFFVMGDFLLALQGLLLMLTGPVLASWITPNLMEQVTNSVVSAFLFWLNLLGCYLVLFFYLPNRYYACNFILCGMWKFVILYSIFFGDGLCFFSSKSVVPRTVEFDS